MAELCPLRVKHILTKRVVVNFIAKFVGVTFQRDGSAKSDIVVPFLPGLSAEVTFKRTKQCVIGKPVIVVFAKIVVIGRRIEPQKVCISLAQGDFLVVYGKEVIVALACFARAQRFVGKQSCARQLVKIDKQSVACKCRRRSIRRIDKIRRRDGQYLPILLTACLQKIDKSVYFTQRSHAVGRRQGRDMQQNSACSQFVPRKCLSQAATL